MLRRRPRAPQRDSLLIGRRRTGRRASRSRAVGEQVGGQADREHPVEPRDLAQQCVQAGRAGIGAQLREQPRAATGRLARLVLGNELFAPRPADRVARPCRRRTARPRACERWPTAGRSVLAAQAAPPGSAPAALCAGAPRRARPGTPPRPATAPTAPRPRGSAQAENDVRVGGGGGSPARAPTSRRCSITHAR